MANMASGLKSQQKNDIRDKYIGEKKSHIREGYGVYSYENRFFRYEGQWRGGKKHGHGKLIMKDGSFYEGEFKNGEIIGHGFKYWASTRNTYSGQFYLGELQGTGVIRYSDCSVYEGEWAGNKREGKGKLTDKDGNISEGEFYNHKMHGDGKKWYSDGSQYEGGFINGKRQGSGVLKMVDGSVFDGQWNNDHFNGQGKMIHSSGFEYDGLWINGKPAQLATKMELIDVPEEGIVVEPGESFNIGVRVVNDDEEVIEDNGRELSITAGFKYVPSTAIKEDSTSFFDAIEDVEETLIQTPYGYTVLPYPITNEQLHYNREATDLTQVSKLDVTASELDEEEIAAEQSVQEEQEKTTSPVTIEESLEEILPHKPVETQRTSKGLTTFQSVVLMPPPPLYRPFNQAMEEENSGTPKSRSRSQKAVNKQEIKPKSRASSDKIGSERGCRAGNYVGIIQDVTNPPFLGVTLDPIYFLITVKKTVVKHKANVSQKSQGPKWDTSKHIQQSVALHRRETLASSEGV